jgi:hypothetical protein
MICVDLAHPSFTTGTSFTSFTNSFPAFMENFNDSITTISFTASGSYTSPKFTYCYQVINDAKSWLSLWFSVGQFALFHFVLLTMSRIFFVGF